MARDKASLDIFWLRDESLEDTGNLPGPELIAAEIVEDLQAVLDQFAAQMTGCPLTGRLRPLARGCCRASGGRRGAGDGAAVKLIRP